jgi:hypothetical protein
LSTAADEVHNRYAKSYERSNDEGKGHVPNEYHPALCVCVFTIFPHRFIKGAAKGVMF